MQKQETRRWEEWEKKQRRETTKKTGKPDLRSVWENGTEEVGRKGK